MPGFKNLTHRTVPEGLNQLILTESITSGIRQDMERASTAAKSPRRLRQEVIRQALLRSGPMLRLKQSHPFQTFGTNAVSSLGCEHSTAL
jgi:hypothetical protein